MDIQEHYSLQAHNTLALQQSTRYFVRVSNEDELLRAFQFSKDQKLPLFMLGEGSNIVLGSDYPGLVVQNAIKGIDVIVDDCDTLALDIGAGENWHHLVAYALQNHWYGLENLALIPGTVGAAPVQNIGAYGVEICSFVVCVRALDTLTGIWKTLDNKQCKFSYRDSIFKREQGRFLITRVQLRLHKKPGVNTSYQALADYFAKQNLQDNITPQSVFDAVVNIRRSRLPDPKLIPNAGSFFKNPIISMVQYNQLLQRFPALVSYPAGDSQRKLAAAWLIDQAGWKGVYEGNVGVHDQQALVLVNRGGASGVELLAFANKICSDVRRRYDINLEIEPVVV